MTLARVRFAGDDRRRPRPSPPPPTPAPPARVETLLATFGRPTAVAVLAAVADRFRLSVADLKGGRRIAKFYIPRQLAYLLLARDLELAFAAAGRAVGGRTSTTVMLGLRRLDRRLAADPVLAEALAQIRRRLGLPSAMEPRP
jgi:chromosomal replication initiation ATPase DnaA